jgi:hypothetical protein
MGLNSAIDSIDTRTVEDSDPLQDINARVVLLTGYICRVSYYPPHPLPY